MRPYAALAGTVLLALCNAACVDPACADKEPFCDPGYVCVKDPLWPEPLGERRVCKKTEDRQAGESCLVSEECEGFSAGTLVCADMKRSCPTGNEDACDLRCRRTCSFSEQCGLDQICWPGGGDVAGVCQEGECGESRQDCPGTTECFWVKPGPSGGLCYAGCDILLQRDCNLPTPPQGARCCLPQEACIHFANNVQAATCLAEGSGNRGDVCDTEEAQLPSCKEGLFCSDLLGCAAGGNCTGVCTQYCNRAGGAPACDQAGALCASFPSVAGATTQWGYCQ
jgi:hypothetical protein